MYLYILSNRSSLVSTTVFVPHEVKINRLFLNSTTKGLQAAPVDGFAQCCKAWFFKTIASLCISCWSLLYFYSYSWLFSRLLLCWPRAYFPVKLLLISDIQQQQHQQQLSPARFDSVLEFTAFGLYTGRCNKILWLLCWAVITLTHLYFPFQVCLHRLGLESSAWHWSQFICPSL